MALLIVGLVLFLGFHLIRIIAPGVRTALIDRLGKPVWTAVYSVVSIVTLLLVIYGFGAARASDAGVLYVPPVWMAHIAVTLMLIATICLVASLLPAGHIATKTKHPMVLSVKIWAVAHLLANGESYSVLLFAAFLAWGVLLRIALKRRERNGELVRRPFVSAKYDVAAVVIGVVVWALMIWKVHEWLIGVAPIPMG